MTAWYDLGILDWRNFTGVKPTADNRYLTYDIGQEKWVFDEGGGGVVANPGGTGLLTLSTVTIDDVDYAISGMGGGGGSDGVTESLDFTLSGDVITATIGRTGGLDDVTGMFQVFTGAYGDLTGRPTIPPAQVNSDWNATSGLAQILNKPTIPAAQVQTDWDATSGLGQILNRPDLDDVLTGTPTFTGNTLSFNHLDGGTVGVALPNIDEVLTGTPVVVGQQLSFMQHDGDTVSVTLPAGGGGGGGTQVNADWDATSGLAQILNKPDLSDVLSGISGIIGNTLTFDEFGGGTTSVNLPNDNDNDYVDSFVATLAGQALTMTLGRTGTLIDLAQTVTLPAGGGAGATEQGTGRVLIGTLNLSTITTATNFTVSEPIERLAYYRATLTDANGTVANADFLGDEFLDRPELAATPTTDDGALILDMGRIGTLTSSANVIVRLWPSTAGDHLLRPEVARGQPHSPHLQDQLRLHDAEPPAGRRAWSSTRCLRPPPNFRYRPSRQRWRRRRVRHRRLPR